MGTVNNLTLKQATGHEMLFALRHTPDPEMSWAASTHTSPYTDDVMVNMAIIHAELVTSHQDAQPFRLDPHDFRWAVDVLDYMKALGLEVMATAVRREPGMNWDPDE